MDAGCDPMGAGWLAVVAADGKALRLLTFCDTVTGADVSWGGAILGAST